MNCEHGINHSGKRHGCDGCCKSTHTPTKGMVERLILDVLEFSSSFCMDVEDERNALADALTVDLMGRFKIEPKPADEVETTLARVLP